MSRFCATALMTLAARLSKMTINLVKQKRTMSATSIAEAKAQFTRLICRAEGGEAIHITRRGKPVAVLLSEQEYAHLRQSQEPRTFWDLIVEMRDDPEFEPIDWSLEDIDSWRDRRPASAFQWPQ